MYYEDSPHLYFPVEGRMVGAEKIVKDKVELQTYKQ